MSVSVVTPPATTPVSLDTIKNFARIDGTDDDALLATFIDAAVDLIEAFTGRSLITRTLKLTLDAFPYASYREPWWDGVQQGAISDLLGGTSPIDLRKGPVSAVSSISTTSDAGIVTALNAASYRLEASGSRIVLNSGYAWPSGFRASDGIEIVYTAGYGSTPANVPAALRTACMLQVASMYEARCCGELCDGAMAAAQPYRIYPMSRG